ncbi:hypothetical protein TNCV_4327391 [Trichonephila clavipes]|nr:hypothetical protein TNCV_4327391 [Trichonephila clavipes]
MPYSGFEPEPIWLHDEEYCQLIMTIHQMTFQLHVYGGILNLIRSNMHRTVNTAVPVTRLKQRRTPTRVAPTSATEGSPCKWDDAL